MTEIKYMDLQEFIDKGYLQEANRRFFHPIGLSLEVSCTGGEEYDMIRVWDYREDPEGIIFGENMIDNDKTNYVYEEIQKHAKARLDLIGSIVQNHNFKHPSAKEESDAS